MHQKFTHCCARRSLMALLWLLLPCIYLHAQKSVQPGRNVTLTNTHITLRDVFNIIERQTGVVLFFGDLNTNQHVDVKFVATPVEEALADMLPPLGLTYEYVKGNKDKIFIRSIVERKKDTVMVTSVSGVVTDERGVPLPGASVRVKGTMFGTATKENGSFTLNRAGEKDVIQVSYTGFVMAEVPLGGKTSLKVRLKAGDNSLNETVVTAYGTSTQRTLTSAITVVKGDQIRTLPNRSFDKSLQGLVPGLVVTNGNGQPGSAPSNFMLRGIATGGSINGGATVRNPLIVIDGVPVSQDPAVSSIAVSDNSSAVSNPMAQINPSDIESISVLKDAAAIALYGSKASNGVILVTTKKGKAGKTSFNFRHQSDFSSRLEGKLEVLNREEYLELLKEAYRNSNSGISDAEILADLRSVASPIQPKFPTIVDSRGDSSFYASDNWANKFYKKAAVTIANELSMSGGNEHSLFYLNMEYTKQDGIVKNSNYDRKSIRFNYENRPNDWLRLGVNSMLSYNNQDYTGGNSFSNMETVSPLNPIRKIDGTYFYNYSWGLENGGFLAPNPIAAAELNINKNTAYRSLNKLYGELRILKNLSFTSTLGIDYMLNENLEKVHPLFAIDGSLDYGGSLKEYNYRTANVITTNVLQFDKVIRKDHNIHFLLGQEAQIRTTRSTNIWASGFANNPLLDHIASGLTIRSAVMGVAKQTLASYFGQLNYNLHNRYFLSASARTDGASNFGKKERFGTYWSIGGGWILSEESFMKHIRKYVDFLKLRGSFGPAGNSVAIADYFRYDYLNMVNYLGGIAVGPRTDRPPGNPGIKWEQTFTWNAGLELRVLNERLSLVADIYNRKTSNLIADNIPLPSASGFSSITDNIGDIKNSGVELAITADIIKRKEFFWRLGANWSRNKNTFVKSFFPQTYAGNNYVINEVGKEYNSFYLPIWAGVNPANGRPTWMDSSGKASEDYYNAKAQIVGKTQPDGFGSIISSVGWKGLELSFNIYYSYGAKIYFDGATIQNDGYDPYVNQGRGALNRWRKPGDKAVNPRRLIGGRVGSEVDLGSNPSTRYLFDGDYWRLSNVSIGYTFNEIALRKFHISGLKVFLQGQNLATITKYSGQDPENVNIFGSGNFLYPQQRSYTIGVNIGF